MEKNKNKGIKMAKIERVYNIPLRKEFQKAPKYKRAKKAVNAVKKFLMRHMKPASDDKGRVLLKLGEYLNKKIWERGIKNPPHHIKVNVVKDDDGKVTAEIVGAPVKEVKEEDKKGKKKEEKKEDKKEIKKEEKEVKVEEKKEEVKKEVKEEAKEVKKEVKEAEKEKVKVKKEVKKEAKKKEVKKEKKEVKKAASKKK